MTGIPDVERETFPYPEAKKAEARQPFLFLALRCHAPLGLSRRVALGDLDEVLIARGSDQLHVRGRFATLGVEDPLMSGKHARLTRTDGAWQLEEIHARNHTWVNGAPVRRAALADGDLIRVGQTLLIFRAPERWFSSRPLVTFDHEAVAVPEVDQRFRPTTLRPDLAQMFERLRLASRVALPILIQGETGCGKELVAREIHRKSGRKPFVAVNCGAIPAQLVDAELFGHRRGAFTGATQDREGHVRAADGGTLFLDEIGDLPEDAQVKLLRVLQENEVLPVGESKPVRVDVRIVAATNKNLASMATLGTFRQDLLARFAFHTVELPALRFRREDLGIIVGTLLRRHAADRDVRFDHEAGEATFLHDWPDNVRGLELRLLEVLALTDDEPLIITCDDLQLKPPEDPNAERIAQVGTENENISEMARRLNVPRTTLKRVLARMGILGEDGKAGRPRGSRKKAG